MLKSSHRICSNKHVVINTQTQSFPSTFVDDYYINLRFDTKWRKALLITASNDNYYSLISTFERVLLSNYIIQGVPEVKTESGNRLSEKNGK